MGDNRKSNALYKCPDCGKMYQAVTEAAVRRCVCGGMLYAVRTIERRPISNRDDLA